MALSRKRNGFTLIEMSIVLVIIGLIIGAVVTGQNMIRKAQLQSVLSDIDQYKHAIQLFQEKYYALPGDMYNAESYWGSASGGCPTGARSGTQTCNGDGNGHIDWGPQSNPGNEDAAASNYEQYTAWQQLASAGMIVGSYTGLAGPGSGRNSVAGVNVPASKISNSGYTLMYFGTYSDVNAWLAAYGHILSFGANTPTVQTQNPVLTPTEAWNIDTKLDDGLPGSGNVMTLDQTFQPNCVSSNAQSTAQYSVNNTTVACMLIFITGF